MDCELAGSENFLIDGFPRNEDNLSTWGREMGEKARVLFVLFFDCDEETCIERCLHRGTGRSVRQGDAVVVDYTTL